MSLSSEATVLHHADLARSPQFALDLASRMVASSRESRDVAALHRWVRRYTDLRRTTPDELEEQRTTRWAPRPGR